MSAIGQITPNNTTCDASSNAKVENPNNNPVTEKVKTIVNHSIPQSDNSPDLKILTDMITHKHRIIVEKSFYDDSVEVVNLYDDCVQAIDLCEKAIESYEVSLSKLNSKEMKKLSVLYEEIAFFSSKSFFEISPERKAERQNLANRSLIFYEKAIELTPPLEKWRGVFGTENRTKSDVSTNAAEPCFAMFTNSNITPRVESVLKEFLTISIEPRLTRHALHDMMIDKTSFNALDQTIIMRNGEALVGWFVILSMPVNEKIELVRKAVEYFEFLIEQRTSQKMPLSGRHIGSLSGAYSILAYFEEDETEKKKHLDKWDKLQGMLNLPPPFGQNLKTQILAKQLLGDTRFIFR